MIAVDLGGTRVKAARIRKGKIEKKVTFAAQPSDTAGQLRRAIRAAADGGPLEAVGVAFPAIVSYETGSVLSASGKYADAVGLDVRGAIPARENCRAVVENDARAALWGELGLRPNAPENAVMMTIGTGIGSAAVLGGKLLRGRHSQAALGGHFVIEPDGRACGCGGKGCLEEYGGERALKRDTGKDFREVAAGVRGGDSECLRIRDRLVGYWGSGIIDLIHAFDPELVLIGGGAAACKDVFAAELEAYVRSRAWMPWGGPEIVWSAAPDESALWGLYFMTGEEA